MGRLQDFLGGGGVWVLGYVLAIAPHGWLVLSDPTWTLLLPFLLQLVCVAKLYVALSWPSPGKEATSEPGKEATPEPGKESTLKPGAACSPSLAGCGETVESRTESALSWLAARGLLPDEGVCPCRFSANKDRAGLNLCEAAAKGDLRRIRKLIAAGADVNECNYDGRTALHISTRNADVPIVTKLLEAGADMVVRDVFGNTPWHHATVNLVVAPRDAHHAHAVIVAFENARKARPANEQLVEQLRQAVVRGAAGEVNALAEQGALPPLPSKKKKTCYNMEDTPKQRQPQSPPQRSPSSRSHSRSIADLFFAQELNEQSARRTASRDVSPRAFPAGPEGYEGSILCSSFADPADGSNLAFTRAATSYVPPHPAPHTASNHFATGPHYASHAGSNGSSHVGGNHHVTHAGPHHHSATPHGAHQHSTNGHAGSHHLSATPHGSSHSPSGHAGSHHHAAGNPGHAARGKGGRVAVARACSEGEAVLGGSARAARGGEAQHGAASGLDSGLMTDSFKLKQGLLFTDAAHVVVDEYEAERLLGRFIEQRQRGRDPTEGS